MENPATWGEAEHIVNKTINAFFARDLDICGLSLEKQITDALRQAELLKDKDDE